PLLIPPAALAQSKGMAVQGLKTPRPAAGRHRSAAASRFECLLKNDDPTLAVTSTKHHECLFLTAWNFNCFDNRIKHYVPLFVFHLSPKFQRQFHPDPRAQFRPPKVSAR
ncbi:MAG: hypothetical protein O7D32_05150, partial [bacterium]|nr:hypothetical protein [bacterium]